MGYQSVEAVLRRLGLWKAVQGTPALLAIVIIFACIAGLALTSIPKVSNLQIPYLVFAAVVVGTVLAPIGYFLGNFWDAIVFDPLYGPSGHWADRNARPLGIFPAGEDLQRSRDAAAAKLLPGQHSGRGIYRVAVEHARRGKAKWEYIEQPLILSKFLRAFIWPAGMSSVVLIGTYIWQVAVVQTGDIAIVLLGGILGIVFVLLFVPYINLRVEHMLRLYEHAAGTGRSRS
jgi:hypothetical protein